MPFEEGRRATRSPRPGTNSLRRQHPSTRACCHSCGEGSLLMQRVRHRTRSMGCGPFRRAQRRSRPRQCRSVAVTRVRTFEVLPTNHAIEYLVACLLFPTTKILLATVVGWRKILNSPNYSEMLVASLLMENGIAARLWWDTADTKGKMVNAVCSDCTSTCFVLLRLTRHSHAYASGYKCKSEKL